MVKRIDPNSSCFIAAVGTKRHHQTFTPHQKVPQPKKSLTSIRYFKWRELVILWAFFFGFQMSFCFFSGVRPLLMLLEKWCQKTAFLTISFPTGFFQAPVLIFTGYQNKKGNTKVVFTGRLQGGVCSLYSIGESVQCIHSLLYVLDNVTNNTSPRTAACRPIAYVAYLLITLA